MVGNTPHDRELLDCLERLEPKPYSGITWRSTWASRDPLRGSAAGGRWSPADSFEVLHTSKESDGAIAETYFHLSRAPVFSSSHLKLYKLQTKTEKTLCLTEQTLITELGVDKTELKGMSYERSQAIGSAAYFLEFDSILVPSARWDCLNLIIFLDRLNPGTALSVIETQDINWPSWRESNQST